MWRISIHCDFDSLGVVVVIGLGKNLLLKSVLGHCAVFSILRKIPSYPFISAYPFIKFDEKNPAYPLNRAYPFIREVRVSSEFSLKIQVKLAVSDSAQKCNRNELR